MDSLYDIYNKLSLFDLEDLKNNSKSKEEYEFYKILIELRKRTY